MGPESFMYITAKLYKTLTQPSLPQRGKVSVACRLTDEVFFTQINSSSTTTVVPLLPQEKAP